MRQLLTVLVFGVYMVACSDGTMNEKAPDIHSSSDGLDGADGGTAALDHWEDYLDDPTARLPYRDGFWYKKDPQELSAQVNGLLDAVGAPEKRSAVAVVTPHARIDASGPTAAEVFARVKIPDTVIILAPNHTDQGARTAIWNDGPFIVPGRVIHIEHSIVERFLELLPGELEFDREPWMHKNAHPTEMQLPFLGIINPKTKIVPISFFNHNKNYFLEFDLERIEMWGKVLAQVILEQEEAGKNVLVVATTDLSHYAPIAQAAKDDGDMMMHITALDIPSLYDQVIEEKLTICGEIPVAVTMAAMLELGYTGMEKIVRNDSSHLLKDTVVGYPGAALWKD